MAGIICIELLVPATGIVVAVGVVGMETIGVALTGVVAMDVFVGSNFDAEGDEMGKALTTAWADDFWAGNCACGVAIFCCTT